MKTIPYTKEITDEQKKNILFWVEELRSGKYEQTRSMLRSRDNQYCCLGVACEMKDIPCNLTGDRFNYKFDTFEYSNNPEGTWFLKTFGFIYSERVCLDESEFCSVMSLNDEKKFTFKDIANVIEACFINRVEIEVNASET